MRHRIAGLGRVIGTTGRAGFAACGPASRARAAVVNALQPAFDGRVPLADAIKQAVTAGDAALKGK